MLRGPMDGNSILSWTLWTDFIVLLWSSIFILRLSNSVAGNEIFNCDPTIFFSKFPPWKFSHYIWPLSHCLIWMKSDSTNKLWLQYYYGIWVLENTPIGTRSWLIINIFLVSVYSPIMIVGLEKTISLETRGKKIFCFWLRHSNSLKKIVSSYNASFFLLY